MIGFQVRKAGRDLAKGEHTIQPYDMQVLLECSRPWTPGPSSALWCGAEILRIQDCSAAKRGSRTANWNETEEREIGSMASMILA